MLLIRTCFRLVRVILPWVRFLVIEIFREFVIACRDGSTENRTEPVDPMVAGEMTVNDGRPERPCGIQRASGKIYT